MTQTPAEGLELRVLHWLAGGPPAAPVAAAAAAAAAAAGGAGAAGLEAELAAVQAKMQVRGGHTPRTA
jgi:hypothetical protein